MTRVGVALLLVAFGGACDGKKGGPPSADVQALFRSVCAKCHGEDGKGGIADVGGVRPRNFCDAEFQNGRTDDEIENVIKNGKNGRMPAFAAVFSPEQVKGLVQQVRAFKPR